MNSASNSSIGPVRRRLQRTASRMLVKAALKRNWWHQAWALADAKSFLRNAGSEQQDRIGGNGSHDLPTRLDDELAYPPASRRQRRTRGFVAFARPCGAPFIINHNSGPLGTSSCRERVCRKM